MDDRSDVASKGAGKPLKREDAPSNLRMWWKVCRMVESPGARQTEEVDDGIGWVCMRVFTRSRG